MKKHPDFTEAEAFVCQTHASTTVEAAVTLLRDFRASWNRRFSGLRHASDIEMSSAPDISEQLYDCAQDLADLHGDGDVLLVMRKLETYMAWESDLARKPFHVRREMRKCVIDYS